MFPAYINDIVNRQVEGKGYKLRVVHLITATSGGAAQAAIRLHQSLTAADVESKVISVQRRKKPAFTEGIKFQEIGSIARHKSSALTLFQQRLVQAGKDPVSALSLDLLDWQDPDIQAADVLHLHAFYNLVSIKSFLSKFPEKKKVITLHDERFYTGGCHQSHSCLKFVSGCRNCPQVQPMFRSLVAGQKNELRKLIRGDSNVVFVCPSAWILRRAIKALPEMHEENFHQIYNPIPSLSNLPTLSDSKGAKTRFGFVSQNLDNPIKNLPLLLSAYKELTKLNPEKYSLTLVGESETNYSSVHPMITQTVTRNPADLQEVLREIDVLVVPSTHDNLPNVLGEALMNGVGLIGSDVGGIPEVIEMFGQRLFPNGDLESLIRAMRSYQITDRADLQSKAKLVFGYQSIAKKMKTIYSL
jgi:glycosyltransferase involved in cell wall biosynthesis